MLLLLLTVTMNVRTIYIGHLRVYIFTSITGSKRLARSRAQTLGAIFNRDIEHTLQTNRIQFLRMAHSLQAEGS